MVNIKESIKLVFRLTKTLLYVNFICLENATQFIIRWVMALFHKIILAKYICFSNINNVT